MGAEQELDFSPSKQASMLIWEQAEKQDWNLFSFKVIRVLLLTWMKPRIYLWDTNFGEQNQGFPLQAEALAMSGLSR